MTSELKALTLACRTERHQAIVLREKTRGSTRFEKTISGKGRAEAKNLLVGLDLDAVEFRVLKALCLVQKVAARILTERIVMAQIGGYSGQRR
jgi:hypothetical protein